MDYLDVLLAHADLVATSNQQRADALPAGPEQSFHNGAAAAARGMVLQIERAAQVRDRV